MAEINPRMPQLGRFLFEGQAQETGEETAEKERLRLEEQRRQEQARLRRASSGWAQQPEQPEGPNPVLSGLGVMFGAARKQNRYNQAQQQVQYAGEQEQFQNKVIQLGAGLFGNPVKKAKQPLSLDMRLTLARVADANPQYAQALRREFPQYIAPNESLEAAVRKVNTVRQQQKKEGLMDVKGEKFAEEYASAAGRVAGTAEERERQGMSKEKQPTGIPPDAQLAIRVLNSFRDPFLKGIDVKRLSKDDKVLYAEAIRILKAQLEGPITPEQKAAIEKELTELLTPTPKQEAAPTEDADLRKKALAGDLEALDELIKRDPNLGK